MFMIIIFFGLAMWNISWDIHLILLAISFISYTNFYIPIKTKEHAWLQRLAHTQFHLLFLKLIKFFFVNLSRYLLYIHIALQF